MKISRKWIEWAHGPGADEDQPLAVKLWDLAQTPGKGAVQIEDPELIAEVVSVAELYSYCRSGDTLFEMGPWWKGQPRKLINEGRAEIRAMANERERMGGGTA